MADVNMREASSSFFSRSDSLERKLTSGWIMYEFQRKPASRLSIATVAANDDLTQVSPVLIVEELTRIPVLKTSRQIKVGAVVETASTEEFLHSHTRMFKSRVPGMMMIEAIFVNIVCREIVDAIQNQIIIVGLVYAVWTLLLLNSKSQRLQDSRNSTDVIFRTFSPFLTEAALWAPLTTHRKISPLMVIKPRVPNTESEVNDRKSVVSVSAVRANSTIHLGCRVALWVELTESEEAPAVEGLWRKVKMWSSVASATAR